LVATDTRSCAELVTAFAPGMGSWSALDIGRHVLTTVRNHDAWRRSVLNLVAAEGLMSRTARSVLSSDLASRLTEGLPGVKDVTASPPESNRHIEQIEVTVAHLVQRLFGAKFAEWRPVSNSMANAAALRALTAPGDLVLVQAMNAGGNASYHRAGVAGVLGLTTVDLPGTYEFGIDAEAAASQITRLRPRVIVIGGGKVLFPYPLRELRNAADEVGAAVLLDTAHVAPLIAAGRFGDPFADGVHVMTGSTHKAMGGPVGGLVLTNDDEIAARVNASIYPGFLQTRDQNKYAAAAISLAELLEHRYAYAEAMVSNAKELGASLKSIGLDVVGAQSGYSDTHMLLVDAGPDASAMAAACARVGVLLGPTNIFGEPPDSPVKSGLRLSVAQVTRQGMRPDEMRVIAQLIDDARRSRPGTGRKVAELVRSFPGVRFSFDEALT
jgi:glycine hydroxymethyltransferase